MQSGIRAETGGQRAGRPAKGLVVGGYNRHRRSAQILQGKINEAAGRERGTGDFAIGEAASRPGEFEGGTPSKQMIMNLK